MRALLLAMTVSVLAGCTAKTPSCSDATVIARIIQIAHNSIESGLLQNDPAARTDQIFEKVRIALTDIVASDHDESIDKHTCTARLRITLPPEIISLKDHRAFQMLALGQTTVEVEGNDIVAPLTYTTYLSQEDHTLIVRSEGEKAPARFIQAAHKVGAFDVDLRTLPDLHGGLTLYSGTGKTLLIEPADGGLLQFHVNYERNQCRPWAQLITEERGDTLVYNNPEVGCSVLFSRLGEILLVEHKGCEMMARSCSPDGIYQKQ
jgi:hypothetical protein